MSTLHILDIESAINHWRQQHPDADGVTLCPQAGALAEVYALMSLHRQDEVLESDMPPLALQAWLDWYDTTPDTPCIAICSTSQGDACCKGCGRTFAEVQYWTEMRPADKRATWRRISHERTAWRFTTYAERAVENKKAPAGA